MDDVKILMYHSIAEGPGPLAIPPSTFRMQLDVLSECGLRGVSLREFVRTRNEPERRKIAVLTFDDGYKDFAEVVVPEIVSRGWSCTVFLPTDFIGRAAGWNADGRGNRRLIDWADAVAASRQGVEIGSHTVTHADLTTLDQDALRRELFASKETIEARVGAAVTNFAAPHGRTTAEARQEIAKIYEGAVSTRLGPARDDSDVHDLPRIEMWYFRDRERWQAYLQGATGYFAARQILRRVGQMRRLLRFG